MSRADKFKMLFIRLIYVMLNKLIGTVRLLLFGFKKIDDLKPKRILIYRIGNIGDIVCAIPSFVAVRRYFPDSKMTLLTSSGQKGTAGASELLKDAWYIDVLKVYYQQDINSFSKKIRFVRGLKKDHYDLFIELPNDLAKLRVLMRDIIFAKLLGVKSALGFKVRTVRLFTKIQSMYLLTKKEVRSLLDILKENGVECNEIEFDFSISEEDKRVVNELLCKEVEKKPDNGLIIGIHPGAKRQTNQWPIERFAELARQLREKYKALIIITGGSRDINKANFIRDAIGSKQVLLSAGKTTILQSAEILKKCSLLVGNDSGVVHLAAAVNTPAVVIHSSRDFPYKWYPYGSRNIVLRKNVDCEICYKEKCDDLKCLKSTTVNEVLSSCEAIVSNRPYEYEKRKI